MAVSLVQCCEKCCFG